MTRGFSLCPIFLGAAMLVASGCSSTSETPPQVLVTPLVTYTRAATGPGCAMPVLNAEPQRPYREVALVEGWGSEDQSSQVIKDVREQSCETGADALMIVSDTSQFHRKQVYGVTPNKLSEAVASIDETVQPGTYINEKEYAPTIGEAGHNGFYMDAVAIDFVAGKNANDPSAGTTASAH